MGAIQILIADDHELFRRTVRSFIESQPNCLVCGEAGDGVEAVEKARQLRPDLVLMDINMPRMDGLEATRIVRRDLPDCNVILVTQNHASIAREHAASVDAHAFVTKSDLTKDLPLAIDRVLGNRSRSDIADTREGVAPIEGWLRGGGALARLVQEFDWTKTSLGPIKVWPQSLRTVIRVLLTSRFPMWMSWGPELTFLYNDAYARMTLGKKHPWALGRPSHEVWAEIWDDIGPRIQKVLEKGETTWDEGLLLFLERSGYREETYHTFSYSPLFGDDGETTGHLCVVTEETDRVIGERRLDTLRSLSAELNKTISEADIFAAISRCLAENQKDLPFTLTYLFDERKQARLVCRTGILAGHPASPESIELATREAWPIAELMGGKDSLVVDDLKHRFESLPTGFWGESPSRALLLPITGQTQGTPAGVFIAALNPYRPMDVSYAGFVGLVAGQIASSIANARAYEQERKRAEALAEVDRAKTAFFSNVSHEFRTPLTLMLGPLHDLLSRSQTHLTPTAKEQLELVNRNGARLLRLVNTLLDFSRIEAGRVQAVYQATDLAGFTSELSSVFRSATEKAGLRLVTDCPDLGEPVYVDRDMWEKVVLNLISNAFKFTFEGEIVVSMVRLGNFAELRVRDTGVGIPPEAIPQLFERFHRVPNTRSRTHEGSGIGLALVHELVKLHGGSVRAESALGRGSTFIVSIPLGQDHLAPNQLGGARTLTSTAVGAKPFVEEALRWLPNSPNYESEAMDEHDELLPVPCPPTGNGTRPRILIADDNADMRQYVARLLAEQYDVETVADGQAALEAARQRAPSLILSDVMMPRLDGFQLLKALREDDRARRIPVVLLSARAGEESRVEGMNAGADDYLIKPFSARELLARVSARLEIARVQGEGEQRYRELTESLEKQVQARTEQLEHRTAALQKQSEDIRSLSAQLLRAQDEERRHIARELHDSAGQTLTVLTINLAQLVEETKEGSPAINGRVEESAGLVQQLHSEIRTASYLLHPPLLDESGLVSAIKWYGQGVTERTGLQIDLRVPPDFGRIPREMELVVFRLVQECLTNIHRHSQSKSATIHLSHDSDKLILEVRDCGKGISPARLAEIQDKGSGVGIRGMRERVRQFEGQMSLESDQSGTRVHVAIPIPQ